jgi:hypothetical protein
VVLGLMVLGYLLHFMPKAAELKAQTWVTDMPLVMKAVCLTAVILIVLQIKSVGVQPFIYFQF